MVSLNRDRLLENFIEMLSVDSYYGDEERVAAIIRPALEPLGIRFRNDAAGNLIGRWAGRGRSDGLIMLNAHMDTVQPTPTMRPVVDADGVRSDGSSVLGADDKAGLAAIIEAMRAVDEAGLDHAPIELVITVGEELGHLGSKAFDAASIDARTAFVFDAGGPVGTVVMRAPGQIRCTATLHGRAAHAGHRRTCRAVAAAWRRLAPFAGNSTASTSASVRCRESARGDMLMRSRPAAAPRAAGVRRPDALAGSARRGCTDPRRRGQLAGWPGPTSHQPASAQYANQVPPPGPGLLCGGGRRGADPGPRCRSVRSSQRQDGTRCLL